MKLVFEWDPQKARSNMQKHGVSFEAATTVFTDPLHLSIFDEDHSDEEDRWVTLGISSLGPLVVVVHTYNSLDENRVVVRIISCRRATKTEAEYYNER